MFIASLRTRVIRTVRILRYCYPPSPLTFHIHPTTFQIIYLTVGRTFLLPVGRIACALLSAIVSQLFWRHDLKICGYQDFASALGTDDTWSAVIFPWRHSQWEFFSYKTIRSTKLLPDRPSTSSPCLSDR